MSTMRAVKIGLAWTGIVWTACYLVFGLTPRLGATAIPYLTHMNIGPVENVFAVGNFVVGLILWNAIVAAGIALAGLLAGAIRS